MAMLNGNMFLNALVEASNNEKKKTQRVVEELEKEARQNQADQLEANAEQEAMMQQAEADAEEAQASAPTEEDLAEEEARQAEADGANEPVPEPVPEEEVPEGEEDPLGMEDFSLDDTDAPPVDGEEAVPGEEGAGEEDPYANMPAPDGLPEADAEGEPEEGELGEDNTAETNVHTNILNLSKLDKATSKHYLYQQYLELRDTIKRTLSIIDKHEVAIEPEIRDKATTDLNTLQGQLTDYIKIRFGIVNYEEALEIYLLFSKQIKDLVDWVHDSLNKKKNDKEQQELGLSRNPDDIRISTEETPV